MVLTMNVLRATWSTLHLRTENFRAAKDLLGRFRTAIRYRRRAGGYVRRSRFRNVRRVLLNELRVFNWMKIFAVREFFEDEIRGPLSHDQGKLRTRVPRLRLKLDQREWLLVQKLGKIVRDA